MHKVIYLLGFLVKYFCFFVLIILSGVSFSAPEDPQEGGAWGPVIPAPLVAVSAANLPDGRILMWSANERTNFRNSTIEFAYTAVWDPQSNSFLEIPHLTHDVFCAHQVLLEDGRVFVNGGRNRSDSPWTSIFDPSTNQWVQLNNMNRGRWYPTTVALPNGTVMTSLGSGGGNTGELWDGSSTWNYIGGINFDEPILNFPHPEAKWWPIMHVAPDGRIFHSGPTPDMHIIDLSGIGSITQTNTHNDWYPKHGTTVMYDEGKLLVAGGWADESDTTSVNNAMVIDLNNPSPQITPIAPMIHSRKFHSGVTLPNGEVLIVGGNTSGKKTNDEGSIYSVEIWNPNTGLWREGASMSIPRNYHSVVLLMLDGRVYAGGGGLCDCSADHQDQQIYSPPYLFNPDGTVATRPIIFSVPSVVEAGQTINVSATPGLSQFSIVKMSSATHAINTDLRYLPVVMNEVSAGDYELTLHSNINVMTPGYWMLFGLNPQGTPSVAKAIRVSTQGLETGPPSLKQMSDKISDQDEVINLTLVANDPDGDTLTFSATGLPQGLSLDSASGVINGLTEQTGIYNTSITVDDGNGGSANTSFSWTVQSGGGGGGGPPQTETFEFENLLVADSDGTTNSSIASSGAASNGQYFLYHSNAVGEYVTFPITTPNTGAHDFELRYHLSKYRGTFRVEVADNLSGPYTQIGVMNDTVSNGSSVRSLSMTTTFSSAGTKYLRFTVTGSSPIGNERMGLDKVDVTSSGGGGSNNNPPTITTPGAQTNNEGDGVSGFFITANDPDGDTLIFSESGLPTGLTINPSTGEITGSTTTAGSFNPTITVDDGNGGSANTSFSWTVQSVGGNNPPTITTPGAQTNNEGDGVSGFFITANDPDGDTLIFSESGLPTGLTINPSTGEITGSTTTAGSFNPTITVDDGNGGSANTSFSWTVQSGGGGGGGPPQTETFEFENLLVADSDGTTNSSIASSGAASNGQYFLYHSNAVGEYVTFPITTPNTGAHDFELRYHLSKYRGTFRVEVADNLSGPYTQIGVMNDTVSNGSSVRSLSMTTTFSSAGTKYLRFTVTGSSPIGNERMGLDKVDVTSSGGGGSNNNPPTITTPGAQTNNEGDGVSGFFITANDPDGDTLIFSESGLPTGLTINPSTGEITGSTTTAGSFNPTITVDDGNGGSANTSFSWTVQSVGGNNPPTITTPGAQTNNEGDGVSGFFITANDPDGDTLIFSESGLPTGLTINPSTGEITGSTTTAGSFNPTITVDDGNGGSANTSFSWTVQSGGGGGGGPPQTETFEFENLLVADSDGTTNSSIASSGAASNGQYFLYHSNAVGEYVTFPITTPNTGAHDFELRYHLSKYRGTFRVEVADNLSGPYTQIGVMNDTVSNGSSVRSLSMTTTFSSAGTKYLRFTVTGSSPIGNERMGLDKVDVTSSGMALTIDPFSSAPIATGISKTFIGSAQGSGVIEYSWSFGDGTTTPFTTDPSATHTYTAPGRYLVALQVRNESEQDSLTITQAVHLPIAGTPISDSTILYESLTGVDRVWNVNPDNDSVAVIDVATRTKIAEIATNTKPVALTINPNSSEVWIANKGAATITRISLTTLSTVNEIALPAGSRPHGIVFNAVTDRAFVALEALKQVVRVNATTNQVENTLDVPEGVRHLALSIDGSELYAPVFHTPKLLGEDTATPSLTDGNGNLVGGIINRIQVSNLTLNSTPIVVPYSNVAFSEHTGPGLPNYLRGLAVSPDGINAFIPSKQDNILSGALRNVPSGQLLDHEHTVRAITSHINLATSNSDISNQIDHDNVSALSAAVYGPFGSYLFVALEGTRMVSVVDAFQKEELFRFPSGRAPQGVVASPDGQLLFAHNYLDRTVSIHDVSKIILEGVNQQTLLASVSVVGSESLASNILLGKQHFYDALDPRLSLESYMSCAICHNDGGHDGRIWDFTQFGEGLRNTTTLNGQAGTTIGPVHWTGNFDEIQDFEAQIRNFAGGTGLMNDSDFNEGTRSQPLGDTKAGFSADLDALAAYVNSLATVPASPYRDSNGQLTAAAQTGKQLFATFNCASCHSGDFFSDSAVDTRHDIGTIDTASGNRLGASLDGFDTPTLKGLWLTPPYLHDGSANTISEAILAHTNLIISSTEADSISEYLMQADEQESAPLPP